jgi:DNA-binding response OmpR family regulator
MPHPVALVAEPDRALRDLLKKALASSGYDVFESESAVQLEVSLRVPSIMVAQRVLLVLSARLAAQAALSLRAAARERSRAGFTVIKLVLTHEFGDLNARHSIDLAPCEMAAELEKPFDFLELQAVAMRHAGLIRFGT